MKEIWLLLSTCVLTGDAATDGSDQIGTRASAYATREAACDDLREFMRPDVNESRPEKAWEDSGELVDDALDFILDYLGDVAEPAGEGKWTYDGTTRSYEWRLVRLEVKS